MVVKNLCLIILLSFLLPANLVAAERNDRTYISRPKSVGLVESVYLIVADDVTGGCWTNINTVKNRLISKLEAENISVSKEPYFPNSPKNPILVMGLVGFKSDNMCIVSYRMELGIISNASYGLKKLNNEVEVQNFGSLWKQSGVFLATNSNGRILEKTELLADELLADILSARKDPKVIEAKEKFFNAYPLITESEFQNYLEKKHKKSK